MLVENQGILFYITSYVIIPLIFLSVQPDYTSRSSQAAAGFVIPLVKEEYLLVKCLSQYLLTYLL